jgi:uncharacterized phage protein (TIGR01671 family)
MREILFRGKRVDKGEWIEGDLIRIGGTYFIAREARSLTDYPQRILVDPESVGQFTGLTDRDGTKIFEGDLVYSSFWNPSTYEVFFEDGEFMFTTPDLRPYTNSVHYLTDFKIVGNAK